MSLTNGLLAYWPLDTAGGAISLADASGNNKHLTKINSGVSPATGKVAGCAGFNGDLSTHLKTSSPIWSGNETQASIAYWVKIPATTDYAFGLICSTGYRYQVGGPGLSENNFTVHLNNNRSQFDQVGFPSGLRDGNWHHLVGTWNRYGQIRVYVDGVLSNSRTSQGLPINSTISEPAVINGNSDLTFAVGRKFSIDEVVVYNRELSSSEIAGLYVNGLIGVGLSDSAYSSQIYQNGVLFSGIYDAGNGNRYYLNNGLAASGFYNDGVSRYYRNGVRFTGLYNSGSGDRYYIDGALGTGVYGGRYFIDSVLATGLYDNGNGSRYYVGGVFGTGYYQGTYYIVGTATDLPASGTGLYDDGNGSRYYVGGVFGTGFYEGTYYIVGAATDLPESGTGLYDDGNGSRYYVGGGLANGLYDSGNGPRLYVDGLVATGVYGGNYYLDGVFGTGFYDDGVNRYYENGVAFTGLFDNGDGEKRYSDGILLTGTYDSGDGEKRYSDGVLLTGTYDDGNGEKRYSEGVLLTGVFDGRYYVDGLPSTGSYDGGYYVDGNPYYPASALPQPSQVQAGVSYGNGLTGTLADSNAPKPGVNLAQLLGLPPFIQL